jgi:hypothetical protein
MGEIRVQAVSDIICDKIIVVAENKGVSIRSTIIDLINIGHANIPAEWKIPKKDSETLLPKSQRIRKSGPLK